MIRRHQLHSRRIVSLELADTLLLYHIHLLHCRVVDLRKVNDN